MLISNRNTKDSALIKPKYANYCQRFPSSASFFFLYLLKWLNFVFLILNGDKQVSLSKNPKVSNYDFKSEQIKALFSNCENAESRYKKIIELGKEQISFPVEFKIEENQVKGCQSTMYLHSYLNDGRIYFESYSDALISSGLAVLLTRVYSGETPENVLKCPPAYLDDLSIHASLSPSRSNGLSSLHLRMKQDALKFILSGVKTS